MVCIVRVEGPSGTGGFTTVCKYCLFIIKGTIGICREFLNTVHYILSVVDTIFH